MQNQTNTHNPKNLNKTEKLIYTDEIERSMDYLQYRALSGLDIWIQLYIYGCKYEIKLWSMHRHFLGFKSFKNVCCR